MKAKKSIWSVIKLVFTWIVVVAAVGMMVFTIISVSTFDRNNRSIFGYKLFIDLTDSMSPDYFNAGDIVIVKNVGDMSSIKSGDIITYQSLVEGDTYGRAVTHMVRYTSSDPDGKLAIDEAINDVSSGVKYASADDVNKTCFLTYGVATGVNDSLLVSEDFVLGQYVGRIPKLGYFFQYLKTPVGYIICILVPFLLLIGMQGINCIKIFKKYKNEQMEAMAAERAQIEAERAESQKMMAELLALKAQLAGNEPPTQQESQTPIVENTPKTEEQTDNESNSPVDAQEQSTTQPTDTENKEDV